ncbi:MAG: DUF4143 domain-containing protein [Woeseia sp.]
MAWTLVPDDAANFENLVASHLLKWVHFEQDASGRDVDLCFFRDTDGREVDFVITERGRPIQFVECKWSDAEVDKGLRYLHARFPAAETWKFPRSVARTTVHRTGSGSRRRLSCWRR